MTDKTDIAGLERPVRDRYDWSLAVWRECDQCGKDHTGTVTAGDGSQICAHCADQIYWSAWQVLAERALDRLAAERQRADKAHADMQLECDAHIETAESWREWKLRAITAEAEIAALKPDVLVMPDSLHRDTKALLLVFASAMAVKLHKAEQKYGYSNTWMQADWQDKCLADFNHHISKGDPLDVANYCAFMHFHGWPTALKGDQVPVALVDERQGSGGFCLTQHGRRLNLPHGTKLFTVPHKPVVFPDINEDLVEILGRPNFTCSGIAELFRRNGADIKRKSENEQAFVIH